MLVVEMLVHVLPFSIFYMKDDDTEHEIWFHMIR